MSTHKSTIFQKSCLAAAVVTLSACSTTPQSGGFDLGAAGDTLSRVGSKTVDITTSAWKKSMYMLGFSEERPGSRSSTDDSALLDEVDLALLEEDALLPGEENNGQAGDRATPVLISTIQHDNAMPLDAESPAVDSPLESIDSGRVALADYEHTVSDNETLWDIAKATTGDANNWHILADVNDLAPNAAVFPGQELVIPADMVKPDLQDAPDSASAESETPTNDAPITVATESETPTNDAPITVAAEFETPTNEAPVTVVAELETSTDDAPITVATESETAIDAPVAMNASSTDRLSIPTVDSTDKELAIADASSDEIQTPTKGTTFKLQAGETLWDFAKRTTGDATNWQAIAANNDISEEQALVVRLGQQFNVPADLIREELRGSAENQTPTNAAAPAETTIAETNATAATLIASSDKESIEATTEVLNNASVLDENQPIKIVEAAYQAEPSAPVTAELLAKEASDALNASNEADAPGEIMVSGTYYPKAIYNDADFSSSLLMRVSPGTRLQVSRALGSWFEVKTEEGTGYVHSRDIK